VSRTIRSRRADVSRDKPLYARLLRLRHLSPSGFLCFVFLEGAVALGFLLALAELVSWWGVLVLPITVAVMVKLNDVVAGALTRPDAVATASAPVVAQARKPVLRPAAVRHPMFGADELAGDLSLGGATVDLRRPDRGAVVTAMDASALNGPPPTRQWADEMDLRRQRARQSAARRYE
jgi:hypothetical protein